MEYEVLSSDGAPRRRHDSSAAPDWSWLALPDAELVPADPPGIPKLGDLTQTGPAASAADGQPSRRPAEVSAVPLWGRTSARRSATLALVSIVGLAAGQVWSQDEAMAPRPEPRPMVLAYMTSTLKGNSPVGPVLFVSIRVINAGDRPAWMQVPQPLLLPVAGQGTSQAESRLRPGAQVLETRVNQPWLPPGGEVAATLLVQPDCTTSSPQRLVLLVQVEGAGTQSIPIRDGGSDLPTSAEVACPVD
ncbi:MAG: hypothetical protein ACRC35_14635, partial [Angustibacter sp.]